MTGYGSSLTETQSKNVKRIMSTKIYQWIYPGVLPRHGDNSVSSWSLNDSQGRITAVPISGGLTGKGANVILADDLVRNLEVARSKIECQKLFAGFRADLLSRINPGRGSLVIVIGTPWSTIDPIAMIHQTMREDPTFPRFEVIKYPARNPDGTYLEEKAFGRAYYDLQYSSLGKMANSLMDLSPVMEGGNRFDVTKLDYVDAMPEGLKWFRGWDLASSDTERNGSDPDYTASCKLAIKQETTPIGRVIHIYVADFVAIREEAPKRNALIKEIAKAESGTTQVIEAFGSGGKDAYAMLSQELRGIAIVKPSKMTGDKSAKAAPLEIPWDAGNVHVLKTAMNKNRGLVEEQFSNFPFARHDDLVDAMAVAYHAAQHTSIGFIL
jgi:phage terminase large subunit-like protein